MKRLRHPVRAIREPFGKAGLIVACVALVAALGGTALAAAKLNSTQKKEVEKIAKKYAGKPGAPGATGPAGTAGGAGAKGDTGSAGTNGTNGSAGTNGESVAIAAASNVECPSGGTKFSNKTGSGKACNGVTGFTKTLPAGETETGAWSTFAAATETVVSAGTSISFPIQLAESIPEGSAFAFNQHQTEEEEFGSSGCAGSVADPTAPPGAVCVYTQFEEGLNDSEGAPELRNFEGGSQAAGVSGATLITGFLIGEPEPAKIEAAGTWAVTAPPAP
jgi:hypothetical protein